MGKQCFYFLQLQKLQMVTAAMKLRRLLLGRKVMTKLDCILKSRDITLSTKAMVFPVVMYGCDCWTIKKAERWRIDAFELWFWKRLEPVHPKGDQSLMFTGRTDVEAETPILWPPDPKSWLIWKVPDAGKDGRQEKKGTTEDEIVGWHHWLSGHEFVNSGSWRWTGTPSVLPSMGSQRVGHDWATELNWTESPESINIFCYTARGNWACR